VNDNNETYDEATTKEALTTAESYIRNNFSIENVSLEEPYQTEMGGMAIDGTVNNEEEFTININEDFTVDGLAIRSKNFPPRKKGCEEKICDY
jgi:hypothetical protein